MYRITPHMIKDYLEYQASIPFQELITCKPFSVIDIGVDLDNIIFHDNKWGCVIRLRNYILENSIHPVDIYLSKLILFYESQDCNPNLLQVTIEGAAMEILDHIYDGDYPGLIFHKLNP